VRHLLAILLVSLIALLGLSGCNSKPAPTDYFPLDKGLSWKYQVTDTAKQEKGFYSVTNVGTTQVAGETATIRRTDDGRDYYLVKKPDGIYRYATRTLFETEPVIDEQPRMVLPLPFLGDAEREWSSKTVSYVIRRSGPSTITTEERPPQEFIMNYSVVSQNETVMVPAGRFKNCLLVEGLATLTMFADPLTGFVDIPIRTREWYAPGVGLVKLERSEPLKTRVYLGGSYLFELVGFNY